MRHPASPSVKSPSISSSVFKSESVKHAKGLHKASHERVSCIAKMYAVISLVTGNVVTTGDSPLADVKTQAISTSSNIGLLSALILTIIFPLTYDSVPGPESNSYMITDPEWVGAVYFYLGVTSSWALCMSVLFSILTLLIMNETYGLSSFHIPPLATWDPAPC